MRAKNNTKVCPELRPIIYDHMWSGDWFADQTCLLAIMKASLLVYLLWYVWSCCHSTHACSLIGTWCDTTTLSYHNQMLMRIKHDPEAGLIFFAVTPIPNWGSGAVNYDSSSSTVEITMDNGEVRRGTVSSNCSKITWPTLIGQVWAKTAEAQNVHVVFMNHLDVGYASFIGNIINEYFQTYFPRAIRLAAEAELGSGFIYTTHSWLVSLYVNCPVNLVLNDIEIKCPSPEQVSNFTESVKKGHIVWHAGPMNMQVELMNEAVLQTGLYFSRQLGETFSYTSTVLSQRDVPGMTAAAIPTFVNWGIKAVSVGVNPASAPPAVPKIFNWNNQIIGIWHPGGYPNPPGKSLVDPGGIAYKDCAVAPDTGNALCFGFRTDNTGPPTSLEELDNVYQILREEFPGAKVFASTLDEFVSQVDRSALPVVNGEIGDTWIQGIAADPRKTAEYRAYAKSLLHYVSQPGNSLKDPVVYNMSTYLIKLPEHTWGLSGVSDSEHWSNDQFEKVRQGASFIANENSWREQRAFLDLALGATVGHPLHDLIMENLKHLEPILPNITDYSWVTPAQKFDILNNTVSISFDPSTGSINYLSMRNATNSSVLYAESTSPIGLFSYHTYNDSDFIFLKSHYGNPGNPGFEKPDCANAKPLSQTWLPSLVYLYQSKTNPAMFITQLKMTDQQAHTYYGAPAEIWVTVEVTSDGIDFDMILVNKTATRLPEATMFSFYPTSSDSGGWECSAVKVATGVLAPQSTVDMKNVVTNGSQYQHAVEYVTLHSLKTADKESITLASPDVPLVCPILQGDNGWTPTPFPAPLKPLSSATIIGMAFNIHNNIWNTNYPLWYPYNDEDKNFRAKFTMQVNMHKK